MPFYVGVDIGSTCAKTIVMNDEKEIVHRALQATGWSSIETADNIRKALIDNGFPAEKMKVVATGYGRVSVPYADKRVTEITCHARGAGHLHDADNLTVIDIGGQDTKIIHLVDGNVSDFIMNDKCSAGTGRFLEVMSNTLGMHTEDLVRLAAKGSDTTISSMCTVFAESEVISLIGRGEKKENIAYAVVDSIVKKVASQVARIQLQDAAVCLTGGLCAFDYLRESLADALGVPVQHHADGHYAGAVGAALSAFKL